MLLNVWNKYIRFTRNILITITIVLSFSSIVWFLWTGYNRYFPNNLRKNLSTYNQLASYLIQSKFEGILLNTKDANLCKWQMNCSCLYKTCLVNGKDIYDVMDSLNIDSIVIYLQSWSVEMYPKNVWWSVWNVYFLYNKNSFISFDENLFPFYKKYEHNESLVFDSKINNDWIIIRSDDLEGFYKDISQRDIQITTK